MINKYLRWISENLIFLVLGAVSAHIMPNIWLALLGCILFVVIVNLHDKAIKASKQSD